MFLPGRGTCETMRWCESEVWIKAGILGYLLIPAPRSMATPDHSWPSMLISAHFCPFTNYSRHWHTPHLTRWILDPPLGYWLSLAKWQLAARQVQWSLLMWLTAWTCSGTAQCISIDSIDSIEFCVGQHTMNAEPTSTTQHWPVAWLRCFTPTQPQHRQQPSGLTPLSKIGHWHVLRSNYSGNCASAFPFTLMARWDVLLAVQSARRVRGMLFSYR